MIDAFQFMGDGVLSIFGEDAFFNGGTDPVQINIEHGVQLVGLGDGTSGYDGLNVERDVATLSGALNPKTGDTFVQNGVTWRLEARLENNGVTQRFVAMKMNP